MIKKKVIFVLVAIINISTLFAQEWQTDLSATKEIAAEENKSIVLVFQGSDWCAPCIKWDREIWSKDEFISYAIDHFAISQNLIISKLINYFYKF